MELDKEDKSMSNNGNNSDNSALISIGNTSFGFNFDSEEGTMNNSPHNSEGDSSDGNGAGRRKSPKKLLASASSSSSSRTITDKSSGASNNGSGDNNASSGSDVNGSSTNSGSGNAQAATTPQPPKATLIDDSGNSVTAANRATGSSTRSVGGNTAVTNVTSSTTPSAPPTATAVTSSADAAAKAAQDKSHQAAADQAVTNLQSIAAANEMKDDLKRKRDGEDDDSGGYNSDDEGRGSKKGKNDDHHGSGMSDSGAGGSQGKGKKKKKVDDFKREERNAREKERSFRIARQINELRNLLSSGGVIVPKGTKSSVLTEAANYIRMLQQHQYRSEIDRHQLVQQIQMIGGGALGQQAATAVRHVAAQNGVWSLGNFGGVPPKSAMMYHQPMPCTSSGMDGAPQQQQPQMVPDQPGQAQQQQQQEQDSSVLPNKIETHDYRFVFNSCTVGLAIASMGGAFIDCNGLFCHLSNYTKQEICAMTIFNLTAREDLQHAFDLISQMLSAPSDPTNSASAKSCVLRGTMKDREDLGLSVALIRGEDGVAKCFCITLIQNPESPFDGSPVVPATASMILAPQVSNVQSEKKDGVPSPMNSTPAYTAG